MKSLVNQFRQKATENVSDMAFSCLGVALLLMLPKNLTYLPYWVAAGSWIAIDLTSNRSRLEKVAELL